MENCQSVSVDELSRMLRCNMIKYLIVDSRSFLEFNTSHIVESMNVSSSKLIKRRLQQDKCENEQRGDKNELTFGNTLSQEMFKERAIHGPSLRHGEANKLSVKELLSTSCHADIDVGCDIIVYDQCTTDPTQLAPDCFLVVFINKLQSVYKNVFLLKGGFLEFQAAHPSLCKSQMCNTTSDGGYKCPPMTSMSQPCLPVSNVGPTKILPFLFLGSQQDALSHDTMVQNGITYVLNVSTTSPRPPFISEGHFLRVPVNDSYCDKLLPFFKEAFQFLDKVRESNSCALVHCLAGISRSPTLAIAYIMRHLSMNTDEAYKYVKDKRPTISPNFNFLGQLLEYEQLLYESKTGVGQNPRKPSTFDLLSPPSPTAATVVRLPASTRSVGSGRTLSLHSPTTAFARLNFATQPSPVVEESLSPLSTTPCEDISKVVEASETDHPVDIRGFSHMPSTPMDQLDQINFKSCFACVDEIIPFIPRGSRLGAKRTLAEDVKSSLAEETLHLTTESAIVTLRSQGALTKRPLVRPSSIAFCSLPASDADDFAENVFDGARVVGTADHIHQWKSRSLEDILNSPDERGNLDDPAPESDPVGRIASTWLPSAVEMLGPSTCTEGSSTLRWWPMVTPHEGGMRHDSGGSISSGSRNSLHGSAEVIEVS